MTDSTKITERLEVRMVRIEPRTARTLISLGRAANEPPEGYTLRENLAARKTGPWEVFFNGQRLAGCWSHMEARAWAGRHDAARSKE